MQPDSPAALARIRYWFNRCKPEVPIPADDPDHWYVDFDGQGLRGERCTTTAASTIRLAEEPTCQLFTGFQGSGKTSELIRLIRTLERDEHFVVYADALHSMDTHNEIAYSDVLVALGLAADRAIDALKQKGVAAQWARRFGEEVKSLLLTDLSADGPKIKPPIVEIGVELKESFSFRLALRKAANDKRRQLLDQTRTFFADADRFVRTNGFPGGLVVILDNLEKLSDVPEVQTSAKRMFINNSDALRAPGVHLIYTLPARIVFSESGPELGKLYDGEPLVLPMVKFSRRDDGAPFANGRQAMCELLLRRLDFAEVFGSEQEPVEALAASSGGYTRDLLRLAQYAIQIAEQLPITLEHVHAAVLKLKRSYTRSYSTRYHDLLAYVDRHRPSVIPAELTPALEDVLGGHFAMIYGNDENWYDVHPLIAGLLRDGAVPPAAGGEILGPASSAAPPALPASSAASALPLHAAGEAKTHERG